MIFKTILLSCPFLCRSLLFRCMHLKKFQKRQALCERMGYWGVQKPKKVTPTVSMVIEKRSIELLQIVFRSFVKCWCVKKRWFSRDLYKVACSSRENRQLRLHVYNPPSSQWVMLCMFYLSSLQLMLYTRTRTVPYFNNILATRIFRK